MLEHLTLYNFDHSTGLDVDVNPSQNFVLRTCQRTLVLSDRPLSTIQPLASEVLSGSQAYQYLLLVICGLKSKLLGENEIVSQFKEAYRSYMKQENKSSCVILVLEKLFKDAKKIRTEHLVGISQKTYASLSRKIMYSDRVPQNVLIIGSGSLAEDLINQFKKNCRVFLTARNQKVISELSQKHPLEIIPWFSLDHITQFSHIANTVGTEETLFDQAFIQQWQANHHIRKFVDLAHPSPLCPHTPSDGETIYRLEEVFRRGAICETDKHIKVESAKSAIARQSHARGQWFIQKLRAQASAAAHIAALPSTLPSSAVRFKIT